MGTLQHIQHQISAVNDLIRINNDRVTGYRKAHEDITDPELKAQFEKYCDQSEQFAAELKEQIHLFGGEPSAGTTLSGKFYRTWLDLKSKVTGKDTLSVLAACEYGEQVAEKAYRDALASDAEISADVRQLITSQQSELKTAHDIIKKYRDLHAAVNA